MSILPRRGFLAVAAVIEIALSAHPMAGKTWRRGKDWRYDIWSRCYRCSHVTASWISGAAWWLSTGPRTQRHQRRGYSAQHRQQGGRFR